MRVPLFVSDRLGPQIATRSLSVGCLIFSRMDQIDFTGPFEVLSRMPETAVQIVGKAVAPVRDVQGLMLMPDVSIAEAGTFDVLLVPGGHGQQELMHDEETLALIRRHVHTGRLLFSVCTGALLCGAAGAARHHRHLLPARHRYGHRHHALPIPHTDGQLLRHRLHLDRGFSSGPRPGAGSSE
jgi:cyclohexyl-isocyanide hydratase